MENSIIFFEGFPNTFARTRTNCWPQEERRNGHLIMLETRNFMDQRNCRNNIILDPGEKLDSLKRVKMCIYLQDLDLILIKLKMLNYNDLNN